jgi:hypothetical protein
MQFLLPEREPFPTPPRYLLARGICPSRKTRSPPLGRAVFLYQNIARPSFLSKGLSIQRAFLDKWDGLELSQPPLVARSSKRFASGPGFSAPPMTRDPEGSRVLLFIVWDPFSAAPFMNKSAPASRGPRVWAVLAIYPGFRQRPRRQEGTEPP